MEEKIKEMIREYEEIKEVNQFTIDKLNNENIIIDNFIRDLKLLNKKEDSFEDVLKGMSDFIKDLCDELVEVEDE